MNYRLTLMDKIHAGLLSVGVAGLVCTYWVTFYHSDFTVPTFARQFAHPALEQFTSVYFGFQSSFPLADLLVAVANALAAFYLIGRDAKAVLFGLIGSGALGFLALIDISFNLHQHLYTAAALRDGSMRLEAAINIACFTAAFWSIWRFWGHPLRREDDRASTARKLQAEASIAPR